MSKTTEIKVPDIGDASDVEIIEVLVSAGDTVEAEDGLITLETDKAAMDVPSPQAGTIKEMKVKTGDKVSEGDVIALLEQSQESEDTKESKDDENKEQTDDKQPKEKEKETAERTEKKAAPANHDKQQTAGETYNGKVDIETETIVLGAGPGGYTAAFRAADLGQKVTLVERWDSLGGVCLNVGCIPSKALLHSANIIEEAAAMADHGISFGKPKIEIKKLLAWKDSVIKKLTGGLVQLAKQRKVNVVHGNAEFLSANHVKVSGKKAQVIAFKHCIIAAGSEAVQLPGVPDDPRIIDSTGALELADIPKRMLVIGGGIIGLEMACVYDALGTKVSVVELTDTLIPGADRDIVKPLEKRITKRYEAIMTGVKVAKVEAQKQGIKVTFEGQSDKKKAPEPQVYDRVLVAVGRKPNGKEIAAEKASVKVDERGFIPVDKQQHTNQKNIFAIGDIAGQPMLAHKATHEGKLAAEVISGSKHAFDARVIPSVAYTDPEVAWVGMTETQAKANSVEYEKGAFPWAASGRALSLGRDEGLTKLLFDKKTNRVIGGAAVGPNAGELIAEVALAIEMGADAEDIGLTIHAHPTLSETVAFAAEAQAGVLTDLYMPKKK